METWPIRFDTVKSMPGAMEVATLGQFVEYEDYDKLLNFVAKVFEERHNSPLDLYKLKASILLQLKREAKND